VHNGFIHDSFSCLDMSVSESESVHEMRAMFIRYIFPSCVFVYVHMYTLVHAMSGLILVHSFCISIVCARVRANVHLLACTL
jgi:hypothetical protein